MNEHPDATPSGADDHDVLHAAPTEKIAVRAGEMAGRSNDPAGPANTGSPGSPGSPAGHPGADAAPGARFLVRVADAKAPVQAVAVEPGRATLPGWSN